MAEESSGEPGAERVASSLGNPVQGLGYRVSFPLKTDFLFVEDLRF